MTRRSKRILSLLLASAMVFTMNTTVFAEEAAEVDSLGVKEEVELADVDSTGTVLASPTNSEEAKHPEDENLVSPSNALEPYKADTSYKHELKDFKVTVGDDDEVVLKNVTNPVSWSNVVDKWDGKTSSETDANVTDQDTIVAHYEAGALIETILTGSNKEDTYLINNDTVAVSENKYYGDGMRPGYRTYDVQKLDDTHFLFVGYGGNASNSQAFASDALAKFTPVFTYDGRTVAYDKSGKQNSTNSKNERLDVDIALVKYENNTVTKIPGVTVASVKVDGKNAKNATVSGQSAVVATKENWKNVYNVISDKQPSFTIKAKIDGKESEAKAQKKAIKKLLKSDACKYNFEISQYVVDVDWAPEYDDNDDPVNGFDQTIKKSNGSVSADKATADDNLGYVADIDRTDFSFDGFNISKVLVDKKKANLVMKRSIYKNGVKTGTASIKLKAGTDYTLEAGSLKGNTVAVLNFKDKGNFIYRDNSAKSWSLAGAGYKYAFRATPSTDKKDKKKFRIGYYKDTNDGFVYSVEE